ncbi:129R [Cherax quadricarinatus iridovirus]|uniref:Uncharacterized protein n=1 Tax=Shrimp hemocyte iridescent virus TaxID=2039780 RepID=A0A291B0L7_9VIRU|nr:129R [Cherax quadricarinatus iridovirus]YP_010084779.1 hypothetical protein KM509_gp027 [Shrimp hemocyte iridescent virus]ASZ85109.1 129R [Cherax quadricarinatus iridovirus]ATE87036.1 hypothetical protein [Shrimp hemocyte iridescent virus]
MDEIKNLPHSNEMVSEEDLSKINSLFEQGQPGSSSKKINYMQILIPTLAFVVLNLPIVNQAILKIAPFESELYFLFVKMGIFFVILLILQFTQKG